MRQRGFTLIELLVVLLLVALLASIVTPVVTNAIDRAKESTLKEDLFVMRKAIDDYYADNGKYPTDLEVLVEMRYIRSVPEDPVTESKDTWQLTHVDSPDGEMGIMDIHSGSDKVATDGTKFNQW
jgi:general secretion pathway protein G